MATKNKRKAGKYPIEVRKLKEGYSFRFRFPAEFGGGWVSVGTTKQGCTYKDAVRDYQSVMSDIARRKFKIRDTKPGALLKEFTTKFLMDLKEKKEKTDREGLYITHFNNHFGTRPLTAIKPADVKSYIDKRLKQISSGTARKEFYYLRKIFKEAAKPEWWYLTLYIIAPFFFFKIRHRYLHKTRLFFRLRLLEHCHQAIEFWIFFF